MDLAVYFILFLLLVIFILLLFVFDHFLNVPWRESSFRLFIFKMKENLFYKKDIEKSQDGINTKLNTARGQNRNFKSTNKESIKYNLPQTKPFLNKPKNKKIPIYKSQIAIIEEKLIKAKDLLNEGLIDKEEYKKLKAKILDL